MLDKIFANKKVWIIVGVVLALALVIFVLVAENAGENKETGETTHEYNNDDVPFVGGITLPDGPLESDEEFIEYVKTKVFPNADSIAHDIINNTWNELALNAY
jgi:hypothetical protein